MRIVIVNVPVPRDVVFKLKIHCLVVSFQRKNGLLELSSLLIVVLPMSMGPRVASVRATICAGSMSDPRRFVPPHRRRSFRGRVLPAFCALFGKGTGSPAGTRLAIGDKSPWSPS